jgi:hypothetical protein
MKKFYLLTLFVFTIVLKSIASIPAVPTNLTVNNITGTSATFSWSGVADSFKIYIYKNGQLNFVRSCNTTTIQLAHFTEGTTYEARVSALNLEGESSQTAGVIFTTAQRPAAPYLYNQRIYPNGIDLYWTRPAGLVDGYYLSIYYGTSINGPRIVKFFLTSQYYYFTGGTGTFTIAVSAVNYVGESPLSNSRTYTFGSSLKSAPDYDFTLTYSGNEVMGNTKSDNIAIYNSSVADELFVESIDSYNAAIFDLNGKKVLSIDNANGNIDISGLRKGIYIVVITSSGKSNIKKFIKQ